MEGRVRGVNNNNNNNNRLCLLESSHTSQLQQAVTQDSNVKSDTARV